MSDIGHQLRAAAPAALAVLVALLVAGCATTGGRPVAAKQGTLEGDDPDGITAGLYAQLSRWRGTPYEFGGLDTQGVDCSGLTYVVYRELFGTRLPRTTGQQGAIGRAVKRGDLAPGDLVFFKTGVRQRHVGIYVEDNMFLHASRSSGVRLSSLDNRYWRQRYWKARRPAVVQAGI